VERKVNLDSTWFQKKSGAVFFLVDTCELFLKNGLGKNIMITEK
jgi:hypothetical protein